MLETFLGSDRESWPALLKLQKAMQKLKTSLKVRRLLQFFLQQGFWKACLMRVLLLPFDPASVESPGSPTSMQRRWFKDRFLIFFPNLSWEKTGQNFQIHCCQCHCCNPTLGLHSEKTWLTYSNCLNSLRNWELNSVEQLVVLRIFPNQKLLSGRIWKQCRDKDE